MAPSVTGEGEEHSRPAAEELAAAQHQAAAHADDPGTGACSQCGVARCETWREADAVILRGLDGMAAGQTVATTMRGLDMAQQDRDLLAPGVLMPRWPVPETDLSRPSAARVYDYFLGGMHNFDVDRELAERVLGIAPWVRDVAYANRRFLKRVVEFLVAGAGVAQFLDIGSGIPTVGNVHEIAQQRSRDARVVYVDVDSVAVAYSRQLLEGDDRTMVVQADMRDVDAVLGRARELLDFSQPIAVLMVSVLLFLPDDQQPFQLVQRYFEPLADGSYLGISHVTDEHVTGALRAQTEAVTAAYAAAGTPIVARTHEQVTAFFAGLELVEPGIVALDDWRNGPDVRLADPAIAALSLGGLARKPLTGRQSSSRAGEA